MPTGAGAAGPARSQPVSARRSGGKAVLATALFVLGFTVVFLAQSVAVIGFSRALLVNSETLMRVGGAVTIVMGLAMLGLIRPLQAERRLHARPTGRILGAPLLGAVFALGWTVCLGPDAGRGAVAGQRHRLGRLGLARAVPGLFYCAGLGIPFLLLAFGFGWADRRDGLPAPAHPDHPDRRRGAA